MSVRPARAPVRQSAQRPPGSGQRGVTLVELVVVLSIVGVIGSLGATMISRFAENQQAMRGRLTLAQATDGAVQQLADQLQQALPNSLRVTSNAEGVWIEWVPVLDAGLARQAADATGATAADALDVTDALDASFDVIGAPLATPSVSAWVVWSNLGTADADVYSGNNRRSGLTLSADGLNVGFAPAGALPTGSDSGRFFIVGAPRTVACRPVSGGHELRRYTGYGWQATQPSSSSAMSGAAEALMAGGLQACAAAYGQALANIGLLSLRLEAQDSSTGARMTLVQQIAVDNTP
jgi:MSHA biogenesis protein MshO